MTELVLRCKLCGEVILRSSELAEEEREELEMLARMLEMAKMMAGEEGALGREEFQRTVQRPVMAMSVMSDHLPEKHPEVWQEIEGKLREALEAVMRLADLVRAEVEG